MWDLIVSVPDHCLSFYIVIYGWKAQCVHFSELLKLIFIGGAYMFYLTLNKDTLNL